MTIEQRPVTPLAIERRKTTLTPPDSYLLRKPAPDFSVQYLKGTVVESSVIQMVATDMLNVQKEYTNVTLDPNKEAMAGLHAKQLGYDENVIIVWWNITEAGKERPDDYKPRYRMFINPKITDRSPETNEDVGEGCFSCKKTLSGIVPRSDSITFTGLEVDIEELQRSGNVIVNEIEEASPNPYIARVLQHEIAHGEGERFPAVARELREITDRDVYISSKRTDGYIVLTEEEAVQEREMAHPLR